MKNSQSATSGARDKVPRTTFSTLPLEVKDRIVKLVDEQDAKYRARMALQYGSTTTTRHTNTQASSSGCYGKGINQLALCSRELGDLASRYLYSVSDSHARLKKDQRLTRDYLSRSLVHHCRKPYASRSGFSRATKNASNLSRLKQARYTMIC